MYRYEQPETRVLAAKKLRQMWVGQLISVIVEIVSILLLVMLILFMIFRPFTLFFDHGMEKFLIVTLLTAVGGVIGAILYLVALFGLREVRREYSTAFWVTVGGMALSAASNAAGDGSLLSQVLAAASAVLSLWVMWLVLQGTRYLLEEVGREDVIQWGRTVWALCVAAAAASAVAVFIPVDITTLSALLVLAAVMMVVGALGNIVFLIYLSRAARAMAEAE